MSQEAEALSHFQRLTARAYHFRFSPTLLEPLRRAYTAQLAPELAAQPELLQGVYYQSQPLAQGDYYAFSYDTYPLLWITNNATTTHALFQDFFRGLQLEKQMKSKIKHRKGLIVYCGFFVVGNRADEKMWHYDYRPGAQAYTLITPLFDWHREHGHLLYRSSENAPEQRYRYRCGEAIVLGEGFLHSTEPYAQSAQMRVLVSLTFGSDRWRDWEIIRQNIEEQSYFYLQPCGHPVGQCDCESRHKNSFWSRFSPPF